MHATDPTGNGRVLRAADMVSMSTPLLPDRTDAGRRDDSYDDERCRGRGRLVERSTTDVAARQRSSPCEVFGDNANRDPVPWFWHRRGMQKDDAPNAATDPRSEDIVRAMGRRLRAKRKEKGWTQETAAEHFGLNPKVYPLWESGARLRSWPRVLKACEVYGMSPNELLGYDPNEKLAEMVEDALDPELLAGALEAIALLAIEKADDRHPSGGDEEFWRTMADGFAKVIAMTIDGANAEKAKAFIEGFGYSLRR